MGKQEILPIFYPSVTTAIIKVMILPNIESVQEENEIGTKNRYDIKLI